MSSRNVRLTQSARANALELSRSLQAIANSSNKVDQIQTEIHRFTSLEGVDLEYLAGVNETTFRKNDPANSWTHAIIAVEVDGVRLIDNIRL